MKTRLIYAGVCGLLLSGFAASAADAALVATFTSGAQTVSLNGTLDATGQNYQINANQAMSVGSFLIDGFSATANSPSAPANGQVALEKAATSFVVANGSSGFETMTINLADNSFTPSASGSLESLTGAASVTFFADEMSGGQTLDYFQYTSAANGATASSNNMAFNVGALGPVGTVNTTVGPVDFTTTSPYTLSSTLTLGLNAGDSATLTFQTDPSPTALPLPGSSSLLALGLIGLGSLALQRKRRFV